MILAVQLCALQHVDDLMTQDSKMKISRSNSKSLRWPSAGTAFIGRNKGWLAAGTTAVVLGGAALFNRANARRAEAETPPSGEFVEVDGVRLHYVERGEGPAVVLLHGNGMMLQDFEASGVLDLAAKGHRVIAFDRPGFGYSDRPRDVVWTPQAQADLIARALKQLGVKQATVVGHSLGTLVALAMALHDPKMVSGLVLISGYYFGTARPDVIPLSVPAIPLLGDVVAHTVAPLATLVTGPPALKASFAPAPVSEKFAAFPVGLSLRPSQVRAAAADTAMMIPAAIALSARYADLRLPVIIMAGEDDVIVHPQNHSIPLAEAIEGAQLRLIPGQGHFLHYAVADQVAAAIDEVGTRAAS